MAETSEEMAEDVEPDVQVSLAAPDKVAFKELVENFGEEMILADIEQVVTERVRSLYDNQDSIRRRLSQAQAQQ